MMNKIDSYLVSVLTQVIKKWIKKNKYTKHKIDFFIEILGWEAAVWASTIIISFALGSHSILVGVIDSLILAMIIFMEMMKYHSLKNDKEAYDWIWERRKHPEIYKIVKEVADHWATADHHKKFRKFLLLAFVAFIVILIFARSMMFLVYISFILSLYKECIFDLDEPEKKEKKQEDSITEVAMKAWKSLTSGLAPKGVN